MLTVLRSLTFSILPLIFTLSFCTPISEKVLTLSSADPTPTNQTIPSNDNYLPIVQTPQLTSCMDMPTTKQGGQAHSEATTESNFYLVSPKGNNSTGNGSLENPWATITHAIEKANDATTIWVLPGLYEGQVTLTGSFQQGIVVRSCTPYQAQLRHNAAQVVTCFTCQGVTLQGFDIAHSGPGASIYVIQIQNLLGDRTDGEAHVSRVVLRNNVIHDSYNNDLVKVNRGARQVLIEKNMFYNQEGLESHIDLNGVTDVIVQENVFFNDFGGSGRENKNDTGGYIVIKDSNGDNDDTLGASNIFVRRNLFFNWEGEPTGNSFIAIGEDPVSYYQASDVWIENNLMLGNSRNLMRAAMQIRGSKDITIRHNTISGDLPASAYAIRIARQASNPLSKNIHLYSNIWSDPTGTMGSEDSNDWRATDFSDSAPDDVESFVLSNNLYWNNNQSIFADPEELINHTDDKAGLIVNPRIPILSDIAAPRWLPKHGYFADGSLTIDDVFRRMVTRYAVPQTDLGIKSTHAENPPLEDILGLPRDHSAPTVGAIQKPSIVNR